MIKFRNWSFKKLFLSLSWKLGRFYDFWLIGDWSVKSDDWLVTFEKNERERERERRFTPWTRTERERRKNVIHWFIACPSIYRYLI